MGERGVAIVLRLLLAGEIMLMLRGVVMDGVVGMRSKSCRSGEGTLKEGMLIRVGLPNRSAAEARGLPLPSRIKIRRSRYILHTTGKLTVLKERS